MLPFRILRRSLGCALSVFSDLTVRAIFVFGARFFVSIRLRKCDAMLQKLRASESKRSPRVSKAF